MLKGRTWAKRLLQVLGALGVLVVLTGPGAYLWLRRNLPVVDGTVQVKGITATVTISRDRDAVPHIKAATAADALFGLGYVHAQDRLWQMEFQRRIGCGRLSEILGEATLKTDRFLRTVGLCRAAQTAWQRQRPQMKRFIEAYVAGINAFVGAHHGGELPVEFTLLGFEPEPWQPVDVMVWQKVLALNLNGAGSDELLRSRLIARVGTERAAQLFPAYTSDGPIIVSAGPAQPEKKLPTRLSGRVNLPAYRQLVAQIQDVQKLLGSDPLATGSNSWVVSGRHTTTGKPLLANDPHLGTQIPSVWYLAHVEGGNFDATGASFPGLPGFAIGHNARIAWGVTNLEADVQDLFIEQLDASGNRYRLGNRWLPLTRIAERIKVKGADDTVLTVRLTRHGPLISDATGTAGSQERPLALRWSALDDEDRTIEAFLELATAQNWQAFTRALSLYNAPAQNFIYADRDGHIGYHAAGAIPVRAEGDGSVPVPGWQGRYDWQRYVPFAGLPHTFDPPEGWIVTANNKPVPDSYPYFLGSNWAPPYRAERIVEQLRSRARLSADDMAALQMDTTSTFTRRMRPLLARVLPFDARSRQAIAELGRWDGRADAESAGASIFWAWYLHIPAALFADELGADLAKEYLQRAGTLGKAIPAILTSFPAWCDDVRTPAREDCPTTLQRALAAGLADMAHRQSSDDPARWRWQQVHQAIFPHNPFDKVAALKPFFSRAIGNGGDSFTVNVATVSALDPYNQYHSPSYRQIVDLSRLDASRFMHTTGQSGNVLSEHYADLIGPWQRGTYLPMRFTDVQSKAKLVLEPDK